MFDGLQPALDAQTIPPWPAAALPGRLLCPSDAGPSDTVLVAFKSLFAFLQGCLGLILSIFCFSLGISHFPKDPWSPLVKWYVKLIVWVIEVHTITVVSVLWSCSGDRTRKFSLKNKNKQIMSSHQYFQFKRTEVNKKRNTEV